MDEGPTRTGPRRRRAGYDGLAGPRRLSGGWGEQAGNPVADHAGDGQVDPPCRGDAIPIGTGWLCSRADLLGQPVIFFFPEAEEFHPPPFSVSDAPEGRELAGFLATAICSDLDGALQQIGGPELRRRVLEMIRSARDAGAREH